MTIEEAIEWMQEEKASFERAPDLNGCPMTEYWQKAIDVYDMAISALRQQDHFREVTKKVEQLTLDDLRQMDGEPVWVICDKGFEPLGLWALVEVCEESIFLTNNLGGRTEYAADVELEDDGITVYRQKPEEGTV